MNLGELLEELRDNILYDRSDQVGDRSDRLWSDKTLIRYINQAQRKFAREALVIHDNANPLCCQTTLVELQTEYTMHPSVLHVISSKLEHAIADLAQGGHSAFQTYHEPDSYYFDPNWLSTLPPGKPLAFGTDEAVQADAKGTMQLVTWRVYPRPSAEFASKTVFHRVVRLPINTLRKEMPEQEPEIPEAHHLDMLDWAAYLALRINDVDAGNTARAADFATRFQGHVLEAKKVVMRKLFTAQLWGFGRNGFSWER
jgi:hypothetical protein